jgi:hypothetical protein
MSVPINQFVTVQPQYIGDDWSIQVSIYETDGVTPVDFVALGLTPGGEFFQATAGETPTEDLTIGNNGITILAPGVLLAFISHSVTANAVANTPANWQNSQTRIQVFVTDSSMRRTTAGVVRIPVIAP